MTQIKTVAFRVDASVKMGTGHVMRCLTLADAMRARGVRCQFISRAHLGNLIDLIIYRGYEVTSLPAEPDQNQLANAAGESVPAHSHWLGCSWEQDGERTLEAVRSIKPDMLVVDHYSIDFRWEELIRPHVFRVMVIDDLADRKHVSNFILDQNLFGDGMSRRYQGLIPDHCVSMLGPGYALLSPEYATLRKLMPTRDGYVRRVLVFMGGSDPTNETGKVIDALTQTGLEHLVVDVVLGVNHLDPREVTTKAKRRPATHLHGRLPSLAGWIARADLMISAGGSTSWERMCLGVPAIVISIADNQTATSQAMMDAGYIDFLGESAGVDSQMIAAAVRRCLVEPQRLLRMGRKSQELVPGSGVERVCEIVLE